MVKIDKIDLENIAKIKKSIIRRLYPPTLQINEPIHGPAILPDIKQIARIPWIFPKFILPKISFWTNGLSIAILPKAALLNKINKNAR